MKATRKVPLRQATQTTPALHRVMKDMTRTG